MTRSDLLSLDSIELVKPLSAGSDVRLEARGGVFAEVPISQAPSAQALIGDALTEIFLEYTFWTLLMTGVETEVEEAEAIVAALAKTVGMTFEVIHLPFGVFPSFTRITYKDVPSILPGHHLYGYSYEGDASSETRIVDIREATMEGPNWVVESGIECFCSYGEGLILTNGELPPELMMPGISNDFWVFASANENVELVVTVTDVESGMAQVFDVTGAEGTLFDGLAAFRTAP
jgi:hypothetical protein